MADSPRRELPGRRASMTLEFKHVTDGGQEFGYRATLGYHADGALGEIFLNANKHQSMLDASAADAAIAVSLAIQHGTPIDKLTKAMNRYPNGDPASPLGAVLDIIAREGLAAIGPDGEILTMGDLCARPND